LLKTQALTVSRLYDPTSLNTLNALM